MSTKFILGPDSTLKLEFQVTRSPHWKQYLRQRTKKNGTGFILIFAWISFSKTVLVGTKATPRCTAKTNCKDQFVLHRNLGELKPKQASDEFTRDERITGGGLKRSSACFRGIRGLIFTEQVEDCNEEWSEIFNINHVLPSDLFGCFKWPFQGWK